ncbi:MAG: co-chaperone GroES, partial [Synechococcus sp. TMED155]
MPDRHDPLPNSSENNHPRMAAVSLSV